MPSDQRRRSYRCSIGAWILHRIDDHWDRSNQRRSFQSGRHFGDLFVWRNQLADGDPVRPWAIGWKCVRRCFGPSMIEIFFVYVENCKYIEIRAGD